MKFNYYFKWLFIDKYFFYTIEDKNFGASAFVPITHPTLELLIWTLICMSIFDIQKKLYPKKLKKNPNLDKFWKWPVLFFLRSVYTKNFKKCFFFGYNMNCMVKKVDFLHFINFLVYNDLKKNRTGHMFKKWIFQAPSKF